MMLSLLTVPLDIGLCIIAVSILTWPEADSRLCKVAVERILISFLLLALMTIFEYVKPWHRCCNKREGTSLVIPTVAMPPDQTKKNDYRVVYNSSVVTDVD